MIREAVRFTFSGHESFQCRQLWLKKGFEFVNAGKSFTAEDAVCELGVGKNMVTSIKYWLKAFNIISLQDEITQFGNLLFSEKGFDQYLEDDASLWLLHYHLIKNNFASAYSLIFNEFRREKIQFNKENYFSFLKRKSELEKRINFNEKTVRDDFDVFRKMYLYANEQGNTIEDSFSGLLTDLQLVKATGKGKDELYYIENSDRESLPVEIMLYSILENENYGLSISLNNLEHDHNSPGAIFALSRSALTAKIYEAVDLYDFITYRDHAGVKELQFKNKVEPTEIVQLYYEK
jgi:hypothetical protein